MAEAEISKIQTGIPFAIDEMQALDSTPAGIGHMMLRWATASGTDAPGYWSRAPPNRPSPTPCLSNGLCAEYSTPTPCPPA